MNAWFDRLPWYVKPFAALVAIVVVLPVLILGSTILLAGPAYVAFQTDGTLQAVGRVVAVVQWTFIFGAMLHEAFHTNGP